MDREAIAKQAAAAYWQSTAAVNVTDLSQAKFPWATRYAFYMGVDEQRRRLLVAIDDVGMPLVFEPVASVTRLDSGRFNLANLNLILQTEGPALPAGLDLPWTVRSTLAGLGGWVASPELWNQEKDAMHMWAHKRPQDGPALFQNHCRAPRVIIKPDGSFTMEFEYFNFSGGVETWTVAGHPHEVTTASAGVVLANGTFFVPYV
jgi:hypothetical protein